MTGFNTTKWRLVIVAYFFGATLYSLVHKRCQRLVRRHRRCQRVVSEDHSVASVMSSPYELWRNARSAGKRLYWHRTTRTALPVSQLTCSFKVWWAGVESWPRGRKQNITVLHMTSLIDGSPRRTEMSAFRTRSCQLIHSILRWHRKWNNFRVFRVFGVNGPSFCGGRVPGKCVFW